MAICSEKETGSGLFHIASKVEWNEVICSKQRLQRCLEISICRYIFTVKFSLSVCENESDRDSETQTVIHRQSDSNSQTETVRQ